jgi:hypothetical protein
MAEDDDEDDESRTRRGVFLKVEPVADGYDEISVKGDRRRFIRQSTPQSLTIQNISVYNEVNLSTGPLRPTIRGITVEKIRAIGTEGEYRTFNVGIVGSDEPVASAKFIATYGLDGHQIETTLEIFLPASAVLTVATELGPFKSLPRYVVIGFEAGGFFAREQNDVLLLPPLSEQRPVKSRYPGNQQFECVLVEWRLAVEGVSIHPGRPSILSNTEAMLVEVRGPLNIPYPNELRTQFESIIHHVAKLQQSLSQLQYALYVIAAVLVVLAFLRH